jgi:hypothetical protein
VGIAQLVHIGVNFWGVAYGDFSQSLKLHQGYKATEVASMLSVINVLKMPSSSWRIESCFSYGELHSHHIERFQRPPCCN